MQRKPVAGRPAKYPDWGDSCAMAFWAVMLISLAAGLVLVIGGALVLYMGALIKNAYQLKIEIKAEMEEEQRRIEQEADKKLRWMKRDLIEEVEKTKAAIHADNQRKIADLADSVTKRVVAQEELLRLEHAELTKQFDGLRQDIVVLDQRFRALRREQRAHAASPAAPPSAETPSTPPETTAEQPAGAPGDAASVSEAPPS
jgi:hypothetical protein